MRGPLVVPALLLGFASCGPSGATVTDRDAGADPLTDGQVVITPDAQHPSYFTDDDGDGYSEYQQDCDDNDFMVHPFAVEVCDDGKDNNCNGAVDQAEPDGDGDGIGPCNGDCDDTNPDISPVLPETPGDGLDNNCDGIVDADYDGDGWTEAAGDCDDINPAINPSAEERCFDGFDNNCNGFVDSAEPDLDGDGAGPCGGDCDEGNSAVGPFAAEIPGDGIDNNCDNLIDADIDGDGWTAANGDCDDSDPTINPAAREDCDDGIDNNCNQITDSDCLSPCEEAALLRSSVGCVYYSVDTNALVAGDFAIAVSNIGTAAANVTVEVKNGATWSAVSGGSFAVASLALRSLVLPHRYVANSAIYAGGAYRITADQPVVAYQFNPLNGAASFLSDASLLLPRSSLDTYHIVPGWPYHADQGGDWRAVHIQVAASASTEVRVTSSIATVASNGIPALQPGVQRAFTLQEGDYLQLTAANANDNFAGTYIESDAPVAVFSTSDCANVPAVSALCCCDHLEEQIFGLQTWGTTYVAARAPRRLAEPSVWQITAAEDNTTITFDFQATVTGLASSVTLNARQKVEYTVNGSGSHPGDFLVTADKPILVVQYTVGAFTVQNGGNNGDPSMLQAVPVEQFLDQYVVLVPGTWNNDYLVLVRPTGVAVQLDGVAVTSGWVQTGSSGYEVNRVSVGDGVHVLEGSQPIGVTVLGWDAYDSYAYPGGLDQSIINPIN